MISLDKPVNNSMNFRIPFGHVVPWSEYVEYYPEIIIAMDGSDITSTLDFYYSMNPVTKIFEFQDENSENDIADCIGIRLDIVSNGEFDEEKIKRNKEEKIEQENEEEKQRVIYLAAFLEKEDNNILEDVEMLKGVITKNSKQLKKDRRKAKVEARINTQK